MVEIETIQQWASLSALGGAAFSVIVWILLLAYDLWRQWSFINWKEKAKELVIIIIMFFVLPFFVVIAVCCLIVGWPILAFFGIREALKDRGII